MIHALAIVLLYPLIFFLRIGSTIPIFIFLLPLVFFLYLKGNRYSWQYIPQGKSLWLYALLAVCSLPYLLFPSSDAFYMIQFWILRCFFGVYLFLLVYWLSENMGWSDQKILKVFINTFLLHAGFAWLCFIFPGFRSFIFSIQYSSAIQNTILAESDFFNRLPTFGMLFFGGGVFYAACQVVIARMLMLDPKSIYLWVSMGVISATGLSISRTSLAAAPIIVIMFLIAKCRIRLLLNLLIMSIVTVATFFALGQTKKFHYLIVWITEPIHYESETSIAPTQSTSVTIDRAQTALENSSSVSTYLIGKGRLFSDDKVSYFQGTDVGYIRLLLFGGIPYVILFFLPAAFIVWVSYRHSNRKIYTSMIIGVAIVQIICNLKGMIELGSVLLFLILLQTRKSKAERL